MAFLNTIVEQVYQLVREKKQEKQEHSHRVAAEIISGAIAGSKHWTLEMVSRPSFIVRHLGSIRLADFSMTNCGEN